jgi:hypothetical protein
VFVLVGVIVGCDVKTVIGGRGVFVLVGVIVGCDVKTVIGGRGVLVAVGDVKTIVGGGVFVPVGSAETGMVWVVFSIAKDGAPCRMMPHPSAKIIIRTPSVIARFFRKVFPLRR